jgi:hypothetical protein
MIYWNPLYEVFLSDGSIFFADERGNFSLTQPPGLQGWGILGDLDCGLVSSKIERATYLERRLLALLAKRNLIVELPMHPALLSSERSVGHYLTFDSDPVAALQRLRSATVCVLGVGGVGAVVLQHLVALGVRSYILVDSDRVEASNLNRQFIFSTKDIERLKVEAASEFVCSRVQNSKITKFANRINSRESLDRLQIKRCDIIVH